MWTNRKSVTVTVLETTMTVHLTRALSRPAFALLKSHDLNVTMQSQAGCGDQSLRRYYAAEVRPVSPAVAARGQAGPPRRERLKIASWAPRPMKMGTILSPFPSDALTLSMPTLDIYSFTV
jgi:hypothetical protein